jgi:hypothetical protein
MDQTTSRLRKTFRYPTDNDSDDSLPEALDEEGNYRSYPSIFPPILTTAPTNPPSRTRIPNPHPPHPKHHHQHPLHAHPPRSPPHLRLPLPTHSPPPPHLPPQHPEHQLPAIHLLSPIHTSSWGDGYLHSRFSQLQNPSQSSNTFSCVFLLRWTIADLSPVPEYRTQRDPRRTREFGESENAEHVGRIRVGASGDICGGGGCEDGDGECGPGGRVEGVEVWV